MRRTSLADYEKSLFVRFSDSMTLLRTRLAEVGDVEVVVGIIGCHESEAIREDIDVVRTGLEQIGLSGRSAVVTVCHRDEWSAAGDIDVEIDDDVFNVRVTLVGDLGAYGWQVRTLLETASILHAPLLIVPPSSTPRHSGAGEKHEWFSPDEIDRLLEPVLMHGQDLAMARFNRHPMARPVESHLVFPVLTGVFGWRVRQGASSVLAISPALARNCLSSDDPWMLHVGEHGFGPWILIYAIVHDLKICEIPVGALLWRHGTKKLKVVFHEIAHVLLREVVRNEKWWIDRHDPVNHPSVMGPEFDTPPRPYTPDTAQLRRRFGLEFNHYDDTLYPRILRSDLRRRIERSIETRSSHLEISPEEWIGVLRDFLVAYRFEPGFDPEDIIDGLFPFFLGRLVGFTNEYQGLEERFARVRKIDKDTATTLVLHETERLIESQADVCVRGWPQFRGAWKNRERTTKPYLPRLGAWQFVPGVDVIVPQELEREDGEIVSAHDVYKEVIDRYRAEYTDFVTRRLDVSDMTDSSLVLERYQNFLQDLETVINEDIFPYPLETAADAREIAGRVCDQFSEAECFHLTHDAAARILQQAPPVHLIMALRCRNVRGLLDRYDPQDALGMTAWTDQQLYLNRVLDVLEKQAEPDWFTSSPLEARVIDARRLAQISELDSAAALARLAGRAIVVNKPLPTETDFYPKLWFFLRLVKNIVSIELFSQIWRGFAEEKGDFGGRLVASIRGHWGRRVLSAHNAFENKHQRIVAQRVRAFAQQFSDGRDSLAHAADVLEAAMDVYHLSITLPDTTFVPLSAWTWASYRNRGGFGPPTPLSSLVERDWASRDFFTTYLERAGMGNSDSIDATIASLMGKGIESEDLRTHMLKVSADPDSLVVAQAEQAVLPAARKLERPTHRPLFTPTDRPWESKYVLNAGVLRLDGTIYILYRAFGDDKVSRIGLAWTKDGLNIDGRLEDPIFSPIDEKDSAGVEDPRTVVIDGRIYMLYTAWDHKVAQIAMASISVEAFLDRRFDQWERHGFAFPGLPNKDAVLYPEKIDGRYVVYHRLDPNMWVSHLDDLACPWPRTGQQIFAGPRAGMMWDGVKIGAAGPPIKTTHGWLNIYHGVDYERSYRLGSLFMPFDDPSQVIYRSPNPILEPEADYELGDSSSWVPHVVFSCGAVPAEDKEIVGPDDDILVYYGAADTVMGVARGKLRDMVPIFDQAREFRTGGASSAGRG